MQLESTTGCCMSKVRRGAGLGAVALVVIATGACLPVPSGAGGTTLPSTSGTTTSSASPSLSLRGTARAATTTSTTTKTTAPTTTTTVKTTTTTTTSTTVKATTTTTVLKSTTTTTSQPTTTTITTTPAGPPVAGTWNLLFSDDFTGSTLNPASWQTCYPWFPDPATGCSNYGNTELEWYMPGQDQVSGGALHLVAHKAATAGTSSGGGAESYPWTSGMATTFGHTDFTYGYVQVVAQIPKGDGFWPALWLLPTSEAWPPEIDIMEAYGNDTSTVDFTNHPVGAPQQQLDVNTVDLSAGYHTYAVDWEPGSITWYLDGVKLYSVTSGVPDTPMYFLADLALDGIPGDTNPDATTPAAASFNIRSVQIWQH